MPAPPTGLADLRPALVALLRDRAWERREDAFRLSSGGWSHDYVDCRRALAEGASLRLACRAVIALAQERDAAFDAAGGLTMGADPLAHGIAMEADKVWFSVRKEPKVHGTGRRVEGAVLGGGTAVLLVEDTVTTGRSMLEALDVVRGAGAPVVLAVALLDRGRQAAPALAERGVPFAALATYQDLGIDPV
ncbi:MAG: orotate phosphoribosyltransferase [Acidimicrobiales bacterium]